MLKLVYFKNVPLFIMNWNFYTDLNIEIGFKPNDSFYYIYITVDNWYL